MERLAITGLGAISPVGLSVPEFWAGLCEGRSGVSFVDGFDTDKLRSNIAASVPGFDPERWFSKKEASILGRVTHMSVAAADEALRDAGLIGKGLIDDGRTDEEGGLAYDPDRIGCLMSTGQGSVDVFEEQTGRSAARGPRAVSPFFIPAVMPNCGTAMVSIRYGLRGPSFNISSACATGTHSIVTAALHILAGEADAMLAGGAEAATRLNTMAGFGNARALARAFEGDPARSSRPFDKRRSGFVMGEGAGALVVERELSATRRGARPLAYLVGWGQTSDGHHLTQPDPEARGLVRAIERALERAGIGPADVDYINPHATSTVKGDAAEVQALRRVFGARLTHIPISATKSMIGHLLGGAGAVESVGVVCALRDQALHPSINVDELESAF
ncbi:MAG: beta-ketoacyl-[acyl-carrier-protein] synthase family protein, partial [Myxococcota bacterium]